MPIGRASKTIQVHYHNPKQFFDHVENAVGGGQYVILDGWKTLISAADPIVVLVKNMETFAQTMKIPNAEAIHMQGHGLAWSVHFIEEGSRIFPTAVEQGVLRHSLLHAGFGRIVGDWNLLSKMMLYRWINANVPLSTSAKHAIKMMLETSMSPAIHADRSARFVKPVAMEQAAGSLAEMQPLPSQVAAS